MLKRVGYFEELRHGYKDCGLLRNMICEDSDVDEGKFISYLENANCLAAAPGILRDVLSTSNEIISGGLYIYTDGVWEWPNDLAYYVKKYHVKLPEDFKTHMKINKWRVPKLSQEKIIKLCEEQME